MPIAENDILKMAEKIQQNESEKKQFLEQFRDVVENSTKVSKPLTIGSTPNSLVICGAKPDLKFTISKKVIDKCLRPEIRDESGRLEGKTGHGLSDRQLAAALDNVKNPIMVLRGNRPDSLVVVTDCKDNQDRQILVSVQLNKAGDSVEINDVTSAYGRKGFARFIENEINKGSLLAANKEKANELLHSIGKKYPEANVVIDFDNSISYTTLNVKYPENSAVRGTEKADMSADTRDQYSQSVNETVTRSDSSITKNNVDVNHQNQLHNFILASLASKHEVKIARIEDNNSFVNKKISNNENKVERLHAEIEDAQKSRKYFKTLLDTTELPNPFRAFFASMINRQDKKLENLQSRIEKIQEKNSLLIDKLEENQEAIKKHDDKISQLKKIDNFLTNMHSKDGRRENFVQTISDLSNWSKRRTESRLEKVDLKICQKVVALSKAETSAEKVQLQNQLSQLNKRKSELKTKLGKLSSTIDNLDKLSALPEEQADKVVKLTADNIEAALNQIEISDIEKIVVTVLSESDKTIDNLDEIVSKTIEEFRRQQTAEQQKSKQDLSGNLKKYDVEVSIIENGSIVGWDSDAFQDSILAVDEQEAISFAKDSMRDSIKENGAVLGWDSDTIREKTESLSIRAREVINNGYGEWVYDDGFAENKERIVSLCSTISDIFMEQYNADRHILNTNLAFTELSERCTLADVKSVIAAAIIDHKNGIKEGRLTAKTEDWAASQVLSDSVESYIEKYGSVPLNMKLGFLEVFANKIDAWEEDRKSHSKGNSVLNRKEITRNAAKLHEHQNTATQEQSAKHKKDNQSL